MDEFLGAHLMKEEEKYGDIVLKFAPSFLEKKIQSFYKKHRFARKCRFLVNKMRVRIR